jgi:hypothetical protein
LGDAKTDQALASKKHLLTATIASTPPNGHAPCMKRYSDSVALLVHRRRDLEFAHMDSYARLVFLTGCKVHSW